MITNYELGITSYEMNYELRFWWLRQFAAFGNSRSDQILNLRSNQIRAAIKFQSNQILNSRSDQIFN